MPPTSSRTASSRRSRSSGREQRFQLTLAEERHAGGLRLLQLRGAGLLADDEARRLLRDAVGDLRAELFERRLRLLASERLERARDHVLVAGQRSFLRAVALVGDEGQAERAQLVDEAAVVVVAKPFGDGLRTLGTDPLAFDEVLLRRLEQAVDAAEVTREVLRRHPADVGDVEPEEDAPERDRLARLLDRSDRVRCAFLLETVQFQQLLLRQPVEVRDRAYEPEVPQPAHELLADTFDVGGSLHPVDQRLEAA